MEIAAGEWDALLARLGLDDVYLRRAYVEGACLLEAGEPTFLHHENTVFACIRREFDDRVDVTTPYGYGGPVGEPAEAFYEAYEDWCRDQGIVSTFVRFHPLYANQRYARIHVEPLSQTIAWRLGDDVFERMHSHHRRVVRKAERSGLEATAREDADLWEFVELYERTMARLDADAFYVFPSEYWNSLASLPTVLIEVRREAELCAAVLCFASKPWLHYHLGASSDDGRSLGASNLALYAAARWGSEQGYELLHLGGGVGNRADSLFEFKRRFDPEGAREFAIGKAIHDAESYRELAGAVSLDGYFPAYRDTS
jgi:hypothetical protein